MDTEAELIERISKALGEGRPARRAGGRPGGKSRRGKLAGIGLRLGIGDDAAIIRASQSREMVLSCDNFLEGVHFLPHAHPPEVVGYKALARATSDLAAMGAVPRNFLLSLVLPARRTGRWLDRFLVGIRRAARRFGMRLAGGDISRHPTVAISITVIGEAPAGRAVTRAGARPGDFIFVSGTLGAAQLGLEMVLRGLAGKRGYGALLRAHLYPTPRLGLGEWLARRKLASAMIDTSDGLSTNLGHLCESSRVGAVLWQESIPQVRVPRELANRGIDAHSLALDGGEDYELLFTVPRARARAIPASFGEAELTQIGEITKEKGIRILRTGGRVARLSPRGWDPFRRKR